MATPPSLEELALELFTLRQERRIAEATILRTSAREKVLLTENPALGNMLGILRKATKKSQGVEEKDKGDKKDTKVVEKRKREEAPRIPKKKKDKKGTVHSRLTQKLSQVNLDNMPAVTIDLEGIR